MFAGMDSIHGPEKKAVISILENTICFVVLVHLALRVV